MVSKKKVNYLIGMLSLAASAIFFGLSKVQKTGFGGAGIEQVPVEGAGVGYMMVIGVVFLLISLVFFMKKSEDEFGLNQLNL